MKTVRSNQFFWTQLLTTALLGGLLGLLLILLPTDLLMKIIFVVMGAVTILSAIPSLVLGLTLSNDQAGKLSLVSAILSMVMGILLIFWHNTILMVVIGVYFLLFPVLEILLARDRLRQFKSEIPKLIIGVVLLVFGPAETLDLLFDVVGWIVLGLTALSMLITVITFVKHRNKTNQTTGSRIFVDHDGDGTVDAVYVDQEKK
ncbi:MAG: hypothetical protein IJW49_08910 [Clostridia bacterium]|nr:hypothetical protein [Clostridia bacterium]